MYHDAYHAGAKLTKASISAVGSVKLAEFIIAVNKQPCSTVDGVEKVVGCVCTALASKSSNYFSDITAIFANKKGNVSAGTTTAIQKQRCSSRTVWALQRTK